MYGRRCASLGSQRIGQRRGCSVLSALPLLWCREASVGMRGACNKRLQEKSRDFFSQRGGQLSERMRSAHRLSFDERRVIPALVSFLLWHF